MKLIKLLEVERRVSKLSDEEQAEVCREVSEKDLVDAVDKVDRLCRYDRNSILELIQKYKPKLVFPEGG